MKRATGDKIRFVFGLLTVIFISASIVFQLRTMALMRERTEIMEAAMLGDLKKLAKHYAKKPPKEWPDHDKSHEKTLGGERLDDRQCLRCLIEQEAAGKLKK